MPRQVLATSYTRENRFFSGMKVGGTEHPPGRACQSCRPPRHRCGLTTGRRVRCARGALLRSQGWIGIVAAGLPVPLRRSRSGRLSSRSAAGSRTECAGGARWTPTGPPTGIAMESHHARDLGGRQRLATACHGSHAPASPPPASRPQPPGHVTDCANFTSALTRSDSRRSGDQMRCIPRGVTAGWISFVTTGDAAPWKTTGSCWISIP